MIWEVVEIGTFLKERKGRYKPNDEAIQGLQRIQKIDFSGNIFLSDKASRTNMILVKDGDLVISGINVAKGAMAVYHGVKDVKATIHYSSYEFDKTKIDINFLKLFLKSPKFINALKEQVPGGIKTEIKPKHLLPLKVRIPTKISDQQIVVESFTEKNGKIEDISNELSTQLILVKQLRQAFFKEAMQGQLVSQNSDDELAQKLIEKIKVEKERLIKEKKIRKTKPLPPINHEEIPFEIPKNWIWCRFGQVVDMSRGRFSARPRNDPQYYNGDYPFLQIGALDEKGTVINEAPQSLNEKGLLVSKMFPKDTIVIAIVGGTIGNLGVLGQNMCFPDSIIGIPPYSMMYNQDFILYYLRFMQPQIRDAAYQMAGQPNIKIPTLTELLFPLPPLLDQQLIVNKLNKLMIFCDELEINVHECKNQNDLILRNILSESLGISAEIKNETLKKSNIEANRINKFDSKTILMDLVKLLREHGRLHAEDLWKMSKFPKDIDAFYAELKKQIEVEKTIKESKEKGYLELI